MHFGYSEDQIALYMKALTRLQLIIELRCYPMLKQQKGLS